MKARTLVSIMILVLAVLDIAGSCATGKKAIKAPIESVYGIWENPDYNASTTIAKRILRPDRTFVQCEDTRVPMHLCLEGAFTIIESWIDSAGNKYYKVDLDRGIDNWYELWRINETDTVFEYIYSYIDYPIEMDPENAAYIIWYRQQ